VTAGGTEIGISVPPLRSRPSRSAGGGACRGCPLPASPQTPRGEDKKTDPARKPAPRVQFSPLSRCRERGAGGVRVPRSRTTARRPRDPAVTPPTNRSGGPARFGRRCRVPRRPLPPQAVGGSLICHVASVRASHGCARRSARKTAMRAVDPECADQPEGLPVVLAGVFTRPRGAVPHARSIHDDPPAHPSIRADPPITHPEHPPSHDHHPLDRYLPIIIPPIPRPPPDPPIPHLAITIFPDRRLPIIIPPTTPIRRFRSDP